MFVFPIPHLTVFLTENSIGVYSNMLLVIISPMNSQIDTSCQKKTSLVFWVVGNFSLIKKIIDGFKHGQYTQKQIYPLEYTDRIISLMIHSGICSNSFPTLWNIPT